MAVFKIDMRHITNKDHGFFCPQCGQHISLAKKEGDDYIRLQYIPPKKEAGYLLVECLNCDSRIKVFGLTVDIVEPV